MSLILPFFVLMGLIGVVGVTQPAEAATNSTLNFQGRLLTNTGGLVPDGTYNIEFNLYTVDTGGVSEWTETRLNSAGQGVTVRNGYYSVYLGDVTAFPTTIDWDQEHWLGMTIRGSDSCVFAACTPTDAEMSPRFELTAVPYAFRAGAVTDSAGNAYTADDLAQLSPTAVQSVTTATDVLRLNQLGTGGLLQLQGDSSDVFTVTKTGATTIADGLTLGSSTSTTAGTIRWSGTDFEGFDGATWVSLTGGGGGPITLDSNIKAYGKIDGATGNALNISGATSARNSAGNYTISLNTALPDTNYTILLSTEDPNTDDANITVTAQTTNNFTVNIGVGDNGATADVPTDHTWHFTVIDDASGGGTGIFTQGGNDFGGTAILGTTSVDGLQIITNSNVALEFTALGAATFSNALDVDGLLNANNGIDITTGNLDLSGGNITNVGGLTATTLTGDGSAITALNGTQITSGTVDDARLSTNISKLDTAGDFTATQTFTGGAVLGNFTSTTAGAIRWNGLDFEGYDGTQWVSFTSGGAASGTPATATFYDSTGGATIGAGAFATINLDATLNNSDAAIIGLAANTVTVTEDGYYEVSYQVTSTLAGGTRSGFNAKLQLDTGGGFGDVAGSQAYHYGRLTTETQGTSAATVVLNLTAGDQIRIQGQGTSQAFTTVASATSLSISRITAASGGGGGGGLSFEQNGNSFGATAILGTLDSNGLRFVTNGANALEFTAAGVSTFSQGATFSGTVDIDGLLSANNGIGITSGDLDLSSGNITGVNGLTVTTVTATTVTGDGSGLTALDGTAIASGTIDNARLTGDVVLTTASQTFTGLPTFSSGAVLGNSTSTTAGAIRWSGTDFEGFDGIQWVSLTTPTSAPLLDGVLAFGKVAGGTGTALNIDGATTVRNGTGDYTVTLDTAATGPNYTVQLTVEEDGTTRDDINITLDNQTTAGFDVTIREGDNSTTADVVRDRDWHFIVFDPDAVSGGGGGGGGGSSFVDGGNSFGSTAVLGTTDTNGLSIITDSSLALSFASTGEATFTSDVTLNGTLDLGTLLVPDAAAQAAFFTGSSTGKGLVIQGAASQSVNPFEIQDNLGNTLAGFDSSGGLVLGLSTLSSTATIARSIDLPDASGTICLSGGNCGFIEFASGTFATDATTNDSIAINKTGASGNLLALQNNGGAVFTVANTGALQIQSTSSTALDIRNVGGTSFFSVDSSTGTVRVGAAAADANGVLFVLDTKNTAGDPTGIDGAQYYNSSLGKFRCYENGVWVDCINRTPILRSFIDTTSDATVDNNTTDYWDTGVENNNSVPNITPSTTANSVYGAVTVEFAVTTAQNRDIIARVERGIGSAPTCGSGTVVGGNLGIFSTNTGLSKSSTITFLDDVATTSDVFYTVCSDAGSNNVAGVAVSQIRITLQEAENSN